MSDSCARIKRAVNKATPLAFAIHCALAPLALLASPLATAATTQAAALNYQITASDLDSALNQFAARSGITLSVDASLTQGKKARV